MNNTELKDKLTQTINVCELHIQRLNFGLNKIENTIPLNTEKYNGFNEFDYAVVDQMIFRFAKLQDIMGNRLFVLCLEVLGEDVSNKPFIDKLLLLEKLEIIENHKAWLNLREIRNVVAHEYPFVVQETVEGLNLMIEKLPLIFSIFYRIKNIVQKRLS